MNKDMELLSCIRLHSQWKIMSRFKRKEITIWNWNQKKRSTGNLESFSFHPNWLSRLMGSGCVNWMIGGWASDEDSCCRNTEVRPARVAEEMPSGGGILAEAGWQLSVLGEVVLGACMANLLFLCNRHVAFDVVPGSRGLPLICKLHWALCLAFGDLCLAVGWHTVPGIVCQVYGPQLAFIVFH